MQLYGLGGIGKTRFAIEFAHRHAEEYTALFFVRADTPGGLQQNLAALCGPAVLNLPEQAARRLGSQFAGIFPRKQPSSRLFLPTKPYMPDSIRRLWGVDRE